MTTSHLCHARAAESPQGKRAGWGRTPRPSLRQTPVLPRSRPDHRGSPRVGQGAQGGCYTRPQPHPLNAWSPQEPLLSQRSPDAGRRGRCSSGFCDHSESSVVRIPVIHSMGHRGARGNFLHTCTHSCTCRCTPMHIGTHMHTLTKCMQRPQSPEGITRAQR